MGGISSGQGLPRAQVRGPLWLFTVHCSLFTVHCSLFNVQCSMFNVHWISGTWTSVAVRSRMRRSQPWLLDFLSSCIWASWAAISSQTEGSSTCSMVAPTSTKLTSMPAHAAPELRWKGEGICATSWHGDCLARSHVRSHFHTAGIKYVWRATGSA